MNALWKVQIVKPESQCAQQGVCKGDVLVGINGNSLADEQVNTLKELMERLGSMEPPLQLNFNKLKDKALQLNVKFMQLLKQGMEMKVVSTSYFMLSQMKVLSYTETPLKQIVLGDTSTATGSHFFPIADIHNITKKGEKQFVFHTSGMTGQVKTFALETASTKARNILVEQLSRVCAILQHEDAHLRQPKMRLSGTAIKIS